MRVDRLQLVGLESEDGLLPVGAHAVRTIVPGPTDGHVTSSANSAAFGKSVALAMVSRSRARHVEIVSLFDVDRRYRARIGGPVFFDAAGIRFND